MNQILTGIETNAEFDRHHLVVHMTDAESGLDAYVAIHRKNPAVPSFGATRMWQYTRSTEALNDALRLSRLMSYKAALAGLPCGGAKAAIMAPAPGQSRDSILSAYATGLRELEKDFITGTDVGISQSDLAIMKSRTGNIIGFNDNSTTFTSLGVYHAIQCCLKEKFQNSSIEGRSFAIQGVGKVGGGLLKLIAHSAAALYVSDINPNNLKGILGAYPNAVAVAPEDIHRQPVDVYAPCALSGAVSPATVGELQCAIVAGGANNQLTDDAMGDVLLQKGILYAPDYVANAGGLIAVYDEYEHSRYEPERVEAKVGRIDGCMEEIFARSKAENRATNRVANDMAEKVFNAYA